MSKLQELLWNTLLVLPTESALLALVNYHGLQLLDEGFLKFLQEEEILEEDIYTDR